MRRNKRFLGAFLASLILLINVPVYALSNTGAAVKAEYLKAEKRAFSEIVKSIDKSDIGKLIEFSESIDTTYTSEVDFEVQIPGIKTRKYVIKENGTYVDRYEDGSVEAYVEGEKVATMSIVANEENLSVRIPELYEKYITVDMSDLASVVNKIVEDELDVNEIIESLPTGMLYNCDLLEALEFSDSEEKILENAFGKYVKLLDKELLKNSYFKKDKNQNLNINNKAYKCSVVSYEIPVSKLYDGMVNIWNEFKNDTELTNLVFGKIEAVYNKMKAVNIIHGDLLSKEEWLKKVSDLVAYLKEDIPENVALISTLYHQDGKILRRDIGTKYYEIDNVDEEVTTLYAVKNSKNGYYAIFTEDFSVEDVVTFGNNEDIHNLVITSTEVDYEYQPYVEENPVEEYTSWIRTETKVINTAMAKVIKVNDNKYSIEITSDDFENKIVIEYIRNKINSKEYDINFNVKVPSLEDECLAFNTRIAFEKDVVLNKIDTKKDELVLNNMSKEEMIKVVEDNEEMVKEKITGKFGTAFYYEEFIKPLIDIIENTKNIIGADLID